MDDFEGHPAASLSKATTTGKPVVVTKRGRVAGAILSAKAFTALTERARFADAVEAGLAGSEAGNVSDHEKNVATVAAAVVDERVDDYEAPAPVRFADLRAGIMPPGLARAAGGPIGLACRRATVRDRFWDTADVGQPSPTVNW